MSVVLSSFASSASSVTVSRPAPSACCSSSLIRLQRDPRPDLVHDRRRGVEHTPAREEHRPLADRVPAHEHGPRITVPRMLLSTSWDWGPKHAGTPAPISSSQGCRPHARRPALGRVRRALGRVLPAPAVLSTGERSYGALDLLFEHKVPARRFARTNADRACHFEVRGARAQLIDARRVRCARARGRARELGHQGRYGAP
jgi:hypothetical protein